MFKSRLVNCPVCGCVVASHNINSHLDNGCAERTQRPTKRSRLGQLALVSPTSESPKLSQVASSSSSPRLHGIWSYVSSSSKQGASFRQSPTAPPLKASVKFHLQACSTSKHGITAEQVAQLLPCTVSPRFLPSELAQCLLKLLLRESACWEQGTWYLFGKKHLAPRKTAIFHLAPQAPKSKHHTDLDLPETASDSVSPDLLEAAKLVTAEVNRQLLSRKSRLCQSTPWSPSYVLVNVYRDGEDCSGAHSDRLDHIGPLPIIASLTLGASRVFRLKRAPAAAGETAAAAAKPPAAATATAAKAEAAAAAEPPAPPATAPAATAAAAIPAAAAPAAAAAAAAVAAAAADTTAAAAIPPPATAPPAPTPAATAAAKPAAAVPASAQMKAAAAPPPPPPAALPQLAPAAMTSAVPAPPAPQQVASTTTPPPEEPPPPPTAEPTTTAPTTSTPPTTTSTPPPPPPTTTTTTTSLAAAASAAAAAAAPGVAPSPASPTAAEAAAAVPSAPLLRGGPQQSVESAAIHLEHNMLLIMWPPCQEEWKHEVPRTKQVVPHSISGMARINLTFRQLKPEWADSVPQCRCGQPAVMRAAAGRGGVTEDGRGYSGKYYYTCDNTKGHGCGFWQWVQRPVLPD